MHTVLIPGFMADASLWSDVAPAFTALGPIIHGDVSRAANIGEMAAHVLAEAPERFALRFRLGWKAGTQAVMHAAARKLPGKCSMSPTKWLLVLASLLLMTAAPRGDTLDQSRGTQEPAATQPVLIQAKDIFPEGEKQITVPAFEQLPAPFQKAVRDTRCVFRSPDPLHERTSGTLFRSTDTRQAPVYAILRCEFDTRNLHSLYILNKNGVSASLLSLPVLTKEGGIVASTYPGWMSWDPSTGLLTVMEVTDMIGNLVHRYQYNLRGWRNPWGSPTLLRIEKAKRAFNSADEEWQKVWEAPEWGKFAQ